LEGDFAKKFGKREISGYAEGNYFLGAGRLGLLTAFRVFLTAFRVLLIEILLT
jgi:hypothetical protein